MTLVTNVFRRGGFYYFRVRVPGRFRALLARKELSRSLRTGNPATARQRASLMSVLTEHLWHDLERAMALTDSPTDEQLTAIINGWLRAELDQDALLRRRSEEDREAPWHAGAILERTPDGEPDRVVEWLSKERLTALEQSPVRTKRELGQSRYIVADANEAHLERGFRHQVFEDAIKRHKAGDTSVARRHVHELFERLGLDADPGTDLFDDAVRLMTRAHRDLLDAVQSRDMALWRPKLDEDPANDLVARLRPSPALPASAALVPPTKLSRRAQLKFSEAATEALKEMTRGDIFKLKRRDDYQNAIDTFANWLERDPALGEVTAAVAGDFQVALGGYPSNANKRKPYRTLKTFGERAAMAAETGDDKLLSPVTINGKYLTPLRQIYEWHQRAGSGIDNPFSGIAAQRARRQDPKEKRRDFTPTELQRFFDLPLFTGARAAKGSGVAYPGDVLIRDWRYWVPLICVFSGMRLNEACGLALADIKVDGEITYFHVRDDTESQSLKGDASRRKVPLHHQLIDVGLLEQIAAWRSQGRVRLFDELRADAKGYYSNKPSRYLNGLTSRIADNDPDEPGKLVFHSTRHTVITRLRAAQVREDVSHEIVGHKPTGVQAGYGKVDLPTLKAAVDKIAYKNLYITGIKLEKKLDV